MSDIRAFNRRLKKDFIKHLKQNIVPALKDAEDNLLSHGEGIICFDNDGKAKCL